MICKVCGRGIQNNEANFCEYCGTPVNGNFHAEIVGENRLTETIKEVQPTGIFDRMINELNKTPIKFRTWLIILLIPMIPTAGVFLYLAMLLYFSFGSRVQTTLKNWARVTIVVLLVSIFALASVFSDIISMMGGLV